MVGAPRGGVVGDDVRGQLAQNRFPRRSVTSRVANDQIRSQLGRISGVDFIRAINVANNLFAVEVPDCVQSSDQFFCELFLLFTRFDNAITLSTLKIQIKPVDAKPVRFRPRPIAIDKD